MICFFITIQLLLLNTSPNKWDSASFLDTIEKVSQGKIEIFRLVSFEYLHELYYILGFIFLKLFSVFNLNVELTTLLMSILMGSLIPIFMYRFVSNIYSNEFLGIAAGFLSMFNPLILWYSNEIMIGIPTLFFITLAFYLLSKFFINHKNYLLILSSFVLGLSLLLRFSSIFVFPAFLFLILIQKGSRKNRMINVLRSAFFIFAPILIYIFYCIIFKDGDISKFFYISNSATPSMNNFNIPSMIFLIGFLINSFTSFFSLSLILGIFTVIVLMGKKKIKFNHDFKLKFMFPVIWIFFFLVYSRFLPTYIGQYSRHNLIIIPGFILLYIAIIYYLKPYLNRKTIFFIIILLSTFCFSIDMTILLHMNFYKFLDFFLFKNNGANFLKYFLITCFFVCLFHIIFKSLFRKCLIRKHKKMFNIIFILFFICITSLLYTIPILYLNHTKINHEKAEALWFSKNTPEDALIISGHEYPFNKFYAKPREIVFINDIDYVQLKHMIEFYLQNNRSVFFSDNSYITNSELMEDKNYKFIKVSEISKKNLRNQYEHEFHYMNYYLMKKSVNIPIFKIEKRIDIVS